MLQVVEGSAVGDGSHEGAKLQRSHRNALAEAAHAAHSAFRLRNRLVGIGAELLAFDVVAGQFAEAELSGIMANALETKFAAEFFKIKIVALGDCVRHVHAEACKLHRRIAGDQAFAQMRPAPRKA